MGNKISVIVSAYNIESSVERCLTSIVNQTYKELDIIVVDDGSTDDTAEKIKKFNDPRIRVVRKENHGISSARNTGLEAMVEDSKFVSFIDGDDVVLISYFEEMMRVADEYGADIVQCRASQLHGNEPFSIEISATEGVVRIYDTTDSKVDLFMDDEYQTSFQCNKLFRKSIFNKNRFRDGYVHEGEALILDELAHCNRFATLDRNLYGYSENDLKHENEDFIFKYITDGLEARESQCRTLHSLGKNEEIVEVKRRALDEYMSRYVNLVANHDWKYRKEILVRLFKEAYRTAGVQFRVGDHLRYVLFCLCPVFSKAL